MYIIPRQSTFQTVRNTSYQSEIRLMWVFHERFYLVSADGADKGIYSAIWRACGSHWDERSDC